MASAKSVSFAVDKLSPSTPSLCIPRVFPNITWKRVKTALEEVGLGEIERVDMINKKNDKGESFKRVFVHFKRWATTPEATAAREAVMAGEMFQVTYDDPWFWKIGKSHAEKPERREKRVVKPKRAHAKKPQLSISTKHAAADDSSATIKALMDQIAECKDTIAKLVASNGTGVTESTTPKYTPTSPVWEPDTPTVPDAPTMKRQFTTGADHDVSDHIADELASETA